MAGSKLGISIRPVTLAEELQRCSILVCFVAGCIIVSPMHTCMCLQQQHQHVLHTHAGVSSHLLYVLSPTYAGTSPPVLRLLQPALLLALPKERG
jgi:hypothetical protein